MDTIRSFTRVVAGTKVQVDLSISDLRPSHDLAADAGGVASMIGLTGELLASATLELDRAEAGYRHWSAQMLSAQVEADPKVAEWKAKAAVESDPAFVKLKGDIAAANSDIEFLRAYHDALRVKASMVRARTELATADRVAGSGGPDMRDAPSEPPTSAKAQDDQPAQPTSRADRLRQAMRRGE